MQGVERILSGRDTEHEQLCKENLATIATFGEALMEVVCRDACDGHDIGRVSQPSTAGGVSRVGKRCRLADGLLVFTSDVAF